MARHDFTVLAVEVSDSGTDKALYKWCRRCGAVRITSAPEWDDSATYLLPGEANPIPVGGYLRPLAEVPSCRAKP
jgi:hypothetical protein